MLLICLSKPNELATEEENSTPLLNAITFSGTVDHTELALAQSTDAEIANMRSLNSYSLEIEKRIVPSSGIPILSDSSTGQFRTIVPLIFRNRVFEQLRFMSHPVIRPSQRLIGSCYVWPNMRRDIAERCRACTACQQSKIHRHQVAPLEHFSPPDARFSHVHVDLVGSLNQCEGYSYILTVVDRFSRWPEAIPLPNVTAKT